MFPFCSKTTRTSITLWPLCYRNQISNQ